MMRALSTAATGMMAQQLYVDTVANNLANVNTTGFKKGRVEFQDLFYQTLSTGGSLSASGQPAPAELSVGHGTMPVALDRQFTQGESQNTGRSLDLMIEGDGFFTVTQADGTPAYTRDGAFTVNAQGTLVTASGLPLEPAITVPEDATSVAVAQDGSVTATVAGQTATQDLGTLDLARFVNPAGLEGRGHDLYVPTDASGQALTGNGGANGFGTVQSGFLESSNVSVVEEMVSLITAQRAYEINSKAIQTAEDMLALANNLRR